MIVNFFIEHYLEFCLWLTVVYVVVLAAVALDLVTGLRKARRNGEKANSRGLKRTCSKLTHYLLPMMAFTLVDTVFAIKFNAPWLTLIYGGFCVACEACSILESAGDKKKLRASADLLSKLNGLSQEELLDVIVKLLSEKEESIDGVRLKKGE